MVAGRRRGGEGEGVGERKGKEKGEKERRATTTERGNEKRPV